MANHQLKLKEAELAIALTRIAALERELKTARAWSRGWKYAAKVYYKNSERWALQRELWLKASNSSVQRYRDERSARMEVQRERDAAIRLLKGATLETEQMQSDYARAQADIGTLLQLVERGAGRWSDEYKQALELVGATVEVVNHDEK